MSNEHVDGYRYKDGEIDFSFSPDAAKAILEYFEQREDIMQALRLHPLTNLHPHVAAFVRQLREMIKK